MIKIKIDEEFVCDGFKFVFRKVDGKLKFTNLGPSRGGKKNVVNPTEEEVIKFFTDKGYSAEAGAKFYDFYGKDIEPGAPWKDSKGNLVKDWKKKAKSVWFRDEYKIKEAQPQTQDSEFRF